MTHTTCCPAFSARTRLCDRVPRLRVSDTKNATDVPLIADTALLPRRPSPAHPHNTGSAQPAKTPEEIKGRGKWDVLLVLWRTKPLLERSHTSQVTRGAD
jgi:hypothetical protein